MPWNRERLRRYSPLIKLGLLWAVVFVFWQFQGGFVSGFLFYAVTLLVGYEVAVFFLAGKDLRVQRELPVHSAVAGGKLEVRMKGKVPFPHPLIWVRMEEVLPPALQKVAGNPIEVLFPGWRREWTTGYTLKPLPRGEHHFREIRVVMGDLFGLVTVERRFALEATLMVYPVRREVKNWRSAMAMHPSDNSRRSRAIVDASSVVGVRDWKPGDRLNWIHWKATARVQELKSKEFEHQFSQEFMFWPDFYGPAYHGQDSVLVERAASLTVSLAHRAVEQHFSVGLLAKGDYLAHVAPSSSQQALSQLYGHMARLQPEGELTLEKLYLQQLRHLKRGLLSVVITPDVNEGLVRMAEGMRMQQGGMEVFWLLHEMSIPTQGREPYMRLRRLGVPVYLVYTDDFSEVLRRGGLHVASARV